MNGNFVKSYFPQIVYVAAEMKMMSWLSPFGSSTRITYNTLMVVDNYVTMITKINRKIHEIIEKYGIFGKIGIYQVITVITV